MYLLFLTKAVLLFFLGRYIYIYINIVSTPKVELHKEVNVMRNIKYNIEGYNTE